MIEKQNLAKLATKMRVLRKPEKNKFLYELDDYAKDCQVRESVDLFLPNRIATQIYYALEGTPYTQPEFTSQATLRDVVARKKFEALYAGIRVYGVVSDEERESFRKKVLRPANPVAKLAYLLKIRQNGRA